MTHNRREHAAQFDKVRFVAKIVYNRNSMCVRFGLFRAAANNPNNCEHMLPIHHVCMCRLMLPLHSDFAFRSAGFSGKSGQSFIRQTPQRLNFHETRSNAMNT